MEIEGRVCRTCLKGDIELIPLDVKSEDELQGKQMLEYLLGSEILDSEIFSAICEPCRTTLTVSCTFKQQCILSEEKITEYLYGDDKKDLFKKEEVVVETYEDPLTDDENADYVEEEIVEAPPESLDKEIDADTIHATDNFELYPPDMPLSPEELQENDKDEDEEVDPQEKSPESAEQLTKNSRRCTSCQITFADLPAYQKHYQKQHRRRKGDKSPKDSKDNDKSTPKDDKIRHCGACDKTFQGINKYKNHYYHVHAKKPGKRQKIPKEFKEKADPPPKASELKKKKITKSPEKQEQKSGSGMTCRPCQLTFSDVKDYRTHYWHEHVKNQPGSNKKTVCEDCGKTVSLCRIKIHRLAHRGKSFFCSICSMGFTMKENLTVHMRIHNQEKKFTCKYCNESFVHWRTRKTHILKYHETDKQPEAFECSMCDKKFGQKYYLDFHMRKHRGDLRHECSVCQKRFISKYALKMHLITHTGEKNHICTVCGKAFGTKGVLKLHMVTHTGERNYVCDVCTRSFTQCHVLRSHMRAAHPEHPLPPPGTILKKNYKGPLVIHQETQELSQISENDEDEMLKYDDDDISEQSVIIEEIA
ncbi:zinc finger protein 782-like [Lutzomyia longipalpis]|uniref:zinc finger protein 782-like n=1 Tax=Lutzomyia longipalpis TaxID=7200 RepID=UPI002483ACFB|nr:zinc finger protein 782-like [Lutzomyia longipalpis]